MQSRVIQCQSATQHFARKRHWHFMMKTHHHANNILARLSDGNVKSARFLHSSNCATIGLTETTFPVKMMSRRSHHTKRAVTLSSSSIPRFIPHTYSRLGQFEMNMIHGFGGNGTRHLHASSIVSAPHLTTSSLSSAFSTAAAEDEDHDDDVQRFADSTIARVLAEESVFLDGLEEATKTFSDHNNKNNVSQNSVLFDIFQDSNMDEQEKMEPNPLLQDVTEEIEEESFVRIQPASKYNMAQLLQKFDPSQTPPDPSNTSLQDLQLWYECESQRESVAKYEKVIADARSREDYASLSTVQHQLLRWYHPLRKRIEDEQELFIKGNSNNENLTKNKTDLYRYGPYLCMLQPEKLAVITAHEATINALQKGGDGSTLVAMASRIGDAVEAEVNVQKYLRKHMLNQARNKKNMAATSESQEESNDKLNVDYQTHTTNEKMIVDDASNEKNGTEYNKEVDGWMYGLSHLQRFMDDMKKKNPGKKTRRRISIVNRRAQKLLESKEEWSNVDKVKLGAALIEMLSNTATLDFSPQQRHKEYLTPAEGGLPAFMHEIRWLKENKSVGHVVLNDQFYKMIVEDKIESLAAYTTRHKPMIVPPREWTGPKEGGYSALKVDLMRTHGCKIQQDALYEADLSTVFDGLNVLGRIPWNINKLILGVAQKCWDESVVLGDIPSRNDFPVPPTPIPPEQNDEVDYDDKDSEAYKFAIAEYKSFREATIRHRRIIQRNMDLRSLRCSALLKLNQAEKFKDFDNIYFPYNLDFRGRAYPVPPHLSNVGSDLCRGMLTFSESKPLGPRGHYWLKVHLANLAGADKMSFDDRASFTDNHMENVRASVNDPFGEDRWWMTLDEPFQGLATCHEIVNAIDSGDPDSYECSLPVHMDGSCNGLQHYAALGRDRVGGKAVNLCSSNKPQDVYSGVMKEVIKRVAEEAKTDLDFDASDIENLSKAQRNELKRNRASKLVDGLIDRGVVKRTVMTSVYGVTYIGARKQIQEKIEEKLGEKGYDVDEMENEIHSACGYLASVTMEVMGELFTGARETMNWLASCARLISSQGQPVAWMSPIGVPAVQPYRQKKPYTIITLLQAVVLTNSTDNLPLHKARQVSAFPPNYVHSLDASHMLFTAIEMDRRGLTFSAVHDSFWTHPGDIDEMNLILRESFVDLYDRPLLEDLKRTW
eukprot:CAMPEP_0197839938 /NCGR_PEP_ID=MMETSP1437-20131217/45035_1 /TAXON_ID=49252 ORGANISM="Eucampia antarctica, Strain CCMP1452" /NCGR_SAMPLE_ID=MMETSP1437 /ASSEMBLY_ACC=CAM_ASM_001096 /LENGTH=1166 /DNA_ID=CAMNT_0043449413 /DNA_START=60 /DNA_END=3558 /DNA_ORIENTATION=-